MQEDDLRRGVATRSQPRGHGTNQKLMVRAIHP